MAGINQGTPEVAVGEPLRLGDNGEYEIEHDPVTDRLIVRDTVNGTEAYVRPETNDQIGNQGAFIRSLVNGEPLADDGRTYSTVQEAERNANGWMFIPPGTHNDFAVKTEGMTVIGAGYGAHVTNSGNAFYLKADNVTVRNLRISSTGSGTNGNAVSGDSDHKNFTIDSCWITDSDTTGINIGTWNNSAVINCYVGPNVAGEGISATGANGSVIVGNIIDGVGKNGILGCEDCVVANNMILSPGNDGYNSNGDNDAIVIGNRIKNAGNKGIENSGGSADVICANNRVSGSAGADIEGSGTGWVYDSNLTGAAN